MILRDQSAGPVVLGRLLSFCRVCTRLAFPSCPHIGSAGRHFRLVAPAPAQPPARTRQCHAFTLRHGS